MPGLIGKKIGMTSIFTEDGKNLACTLVELGPNVVTQVRTKEQDGYEAVQLGFGEAKEKNVSSQLKGHFKKAKTAPKRKLVEFKGFDNNVGLGDVLKAEDLLTVGEFVDVVGTSKGKGFQGVVKRHNFGGVGQATHGQHNRLRHPGAIGACSTPSRVFKGLKMAGRMGNDRVTIQNLQVLRIIGDRNVVVLNGSIPGAKNSFVILEK